MKGTVTAKSGSMVRLRQKPSINCPVWWNIPVGTELEVTGQQGNWSKCVCGSLTGWMKNEFIRSGGEEASATPETEAGEGVSLPEDSGPEEALALLAEVYRTLKETCERIMNVIGRG